jgi:hypothetical protein
MQKPRATGTQNDGGWRLSCKFAPPARFPLQIRIVETAILQTSALTKNTPGSTFR